MMNIITKKRKTGNLGEDIACRFLMKRGFDIIERNYLKKCGEIDIIAIKAGKIHFIEVKSVSSETLGNVSLAGQADETNGNSTFRPEDNIHSWKLQRIAKTIQIYLQEKDVSGETGWLFDVITVYIDKKRRISKVYMLENVIL